MDFDLAYANSDFIPGAELLPAEWARRAASFREEMGERAQLGLSYGAGARQKFDLFLPKGQPEGLLIFVHGGYWLETDRDLWSHYAKGAVARGWAVGMPSYTLAPEARISDMVKEVARAVEALAFVVPAVPITVTGHSAGGHLAARMAAQGTEFDTETARRIRRVVPISPLADLDPIAETRMNGDLRLDAAEIAAESPARLTPTPDMAVRVWVGGQERPAFLWQARLLSEAWGCPWHVAVGRHHFDVIEDLCDPTSLLTEVLIGTRDLL